MPIYEKERERELCCRDDEPNNCVNTPPCPTTLDVAPSALIHALLSRSPRVILCCMIR